MKSISIKKMILALSALSVLGAVNTRANTPAAVAVAVAPFVAGAAYSALIYPQTFFENDPAQAAKEYLAGFTLGVIPGVNLLTLLCAAVSPVPNELAAVGISAGFLTCLYSVPKALELLNKAK